MNTPYFVWMSELCGAGSPLPKKAYLLFNKNAKAIYDADKETLIAKGLLPMEAEILSDKDFSRANRITDFCADNHITLLTYENILYPRPIFDSDTPPCVFYCKGRVEKLETRAYASCIGSRLCTENGYRTAYDFGYRLALSGISVVTGLAAGIDRAAALGALDAGGFCVGFLGCGINMIYPDENADLFERMYQNGLVMTEFSPYTEPRKTFFPIRNRSIAALGDITVVVEARRRSGALITARCAEAYGKKVYAVPGDNADERCAGSNDLICGGAVSVVDAGKITERFEKLYPEVVSFRHIKAPPDVEMPPHVSKKKELLKEKNKTGNTGNNEKTEKAVKTAKTEKTEKTGKADVSAMSRTEKLIYERIFSCDCTADELAAELDIPAPEILTDLTMLEISGYITSCAGGKYSAGENDTDE